MKATEWSTRIVHEASQHDENWFVTLTFSDEHLPIDYSVNVRDLQLFMKRLRKIVYPAKVRFFAAGEYGERTLRPHYHLILFGFSDPGRKLWRRTDRGDLIYRCPLLEKAWPFGNVEAGSVTSQSAEYVARYCMKKVGGDMAKEHYRRIHPMTGELVTVRPEFAVMSSRPGIGADWYSRFRDDAFPSDFVTIDGAKKTVPEYYRKKFAEQDEATHVAIKRRKQAALLKTAADRTPERLAVREEVRLGRVKRLGRGD